MTDTLEIEGHRIGPGEKCYLIAELSANHDRDLDQALALVDIAADAGWDCVKFQTYNEDSLTVPSRHPSMRIDPVWGTDNLYDLYKTAGMPMEFHEPLFRRARERGLLPFTSVYDPRDLDFVETLGCAIYKIASFEMTFDDLLIAVAGTGKPIILSTGMANLVEIRDALGLLSHAYQTDASQPQTTDFAGCLDASILQDRVSLLHCTTEYPCPLEAVNLRAMDTLAETFGLAVGYSDHTEGIAVSLAAAARGASVLEKHLTLDRSMPGPDHAASIEPTELVALVSGVRSIEQALGSAVKQPAEVERKNAAIARKSLRATSAIATGGAFTEQNIGAKRPGNGISPMHYWSLLGRTSTRDYAIDDLLDERSATDQGDPVA